MSAPTWATAIVDQVCADAGVERPTLSWRRRRSEHSTGVARRSAGAIAVRAGSDPLDQQLTLLHELAHWIGPAPARRGRRTTHHGRAFYRIAFRLYRHHGLATADAMRLEAARYPSALRHAADLGVPGATELLAERQSAIRARPRRRWRVLVAEHAVRLERDGRWHACVVCGQRVVGATLSRIRRGRGVVRHVLMGAELSA